MGVTAPSPIIRTTFVPLHLLRTDAPPFYLLAFAIARGATAMLNFFQSEALSMASEYSLTDVLERLYQNQLALEAAVMELTLWAEQKNALEIGENVRGAFQTIDENAGHIKQGLARLNRKKPS
jgi:hypothetical protein